MPACAPVMETAGTPMRVQRDGRERDGLLFAGGEEHVHLAFAGQRRDVLREFDQAVGHAAHRGDDDDDLVAARMVFRHALGDILDAVGVADRRAAVFLNNQCHRNYFKPAGKTFWRLKTENGA